MMAQQKKMDLNGLKIWREKLRRGDEVVHAKTINNTLKLIHGKIRSSQRRGVELKATAGGHISFAFWTDLYPPGTGLDDIKKPAPVDEPTPIRAKTLLGSGLVSFDLPEKKAEAEPELDPEVDSQPAWAAFGDEPPKDGAPSSSPPDDTQALAAPTAKRLRAKRTRQTHELTAIGNIFRAERLKRRHDQRTFAPHVGVTYGKLSEIELGDVKPDDDALLKLSEVTGVSLDVLLEARDGADDTGADPLKDIAREHELQRELRATREAAEALGRKVNLLEGEAKASDIVSANNAEILSKTQERLEAVRQELDLTKTALASERAAASRPALGAKQLEALHAYLPKLEALTPIPADPEKRAAWYEAALALFPAPGR
jgi:transcriptional regulator with XRE-family HTH domain